MKRGLVAFASGAVFAVGLGLSGMTQPAKIVGFLSFGSPRWDPALLLVMAGAVTVFHLAYRLSRGLRGPIFGGGFSSPSATRIDRRLVAGALLFGVGWGVAGFCPGPAIVAAVAGMPAALWFLPGMVGGLLLARVPGRLLPRD